MSKNEVMVMVVFIHSADERLLERGCGQCKDAVLGSGHGRVASPGDCVTAQVVPPGDRSGSDERDGPGCTCAQHAH